MDVVSQILGCRAHAESRKKFAASCVAFMKQYGFDGLDIDWEYPTGGGDPGNVERPEDADNFILLLTELRKPA